MHLIVDALGLPLTFEITEGQRHDIVPAPALVQRTRPRRLLADKAYSTHDFRAVLAAIDCDPVIPSSSSWINPPPYDKELYKARAEVECTFSLLKQARRFATRYEKTLRNYAELRRRRCHRVRTTLAANLATVSGSAVDVSVSVVVGGDGDGDGDVERGR